jgi:hypothetical protein
MPLHAMLAFEDGAYPELAVSGRALAMGNAFIAKVDDSSAAFYNPAGLGTVRYPHFHLSNFHIETNRGWMTAATGGSLSSGSGNFMKGFSLDGTRQILKNHEDKLAHSRYHFMPNFTARHLTMGYLITRQTRGTISSDEGAKYEYAERTDHGPYVGFNLALLGGIFKVGASAIYLNRKEVIGESDPEETLELGDGDYDKGTAFVVTTGFKLTLPIAPLPILAVKVNNSTGGEFKKNGENAPTDIKQTIDVGFSITPEIGRGSRIHLEMNYKDATGKHEGFSSARKMAFGMEIDFLRTFFIRAGYGDGFGSGGLGIRSKKLDFDLTTYAVDTTSSKFRGKEDRRFAMTISTGF